MPTRIITLSEFKIKSSSMIAELKEHDEPLIIAQHGKPKAVLMRFDKYGALLKKMEDMEDLLAMKDAMSTPEDEAISLENYLNKKYVPQG